jgi:hypothetical protein
MISFILGAWNSPNPRPHLANIARMEALLALAGMTASANMPAARMRRPRLHSWPDEYRPLSASRAYRRGRDRMLLSHPVDQVAVVC